VLDDGNDKSGGEVGSDNVYREKAEPVLVLLSDLYSEEKMLVCDSRSSSCPTYMSYWLLLLLF